MGSNITTFLGRAPVTKDRICISDADTPGVPREDGRFNVNGPSVLLAPEWMPEPPGRYLMYFAHHHGRSIRLAAAAQNGLRDPCILDDGNGQRWLFYATAGEDALAVTEIAGS